MICVEVCGYYLIFCTVGEWYIKEDEVKNQYLKELFRIWDRYEEWD